MKVTIIDVETIKEYPAYIHQLPRSGDTLTYNHDADGEKYAVSGTVDSFGHHVNNVNHIITQETIIFLVDFRIVTPDRGPIDGDVEAEFSRRYVAHQLKSKVCSVCGEGFAHSDTSTAVVTGPHQTAHARCWRLMSSSTQ